MSREDLRNEVAKLLVVQHGFLDTDEAYVAIDRSIAEDPSMWHDEADPTELANCVAESDDDE